MSELYQFRTEGHMYRVVKFDDDWNVISINYVYLIVQQGHPKWQCTCQRGAFGTCRHRLMRAEFQQELKIDSGWFYDYQTKTWDIPVNAPERKPVWRRAKLRQQLKESAQ